MWFRLTSTTITSIFSVVQWRLKALPTGVMLKIYVFETFGQSKAYFICVYLLHFGLRFSRSECQPWVVLPSVWCKCRYQIWVTFERCKLCHFMLLIHFCLFVLQERYGFPKRSQSRFIRRKPRPLTRNWRRHFLALLTQNYMTWQVNTTTENSQTVLMVNPQETKGAFATEEPFHSS